MSKYGYAIIQEADFGGTMYEISARQFTLCDEEKDKLKSRYGYVLAVLDKDMDQPLAVFKTKEAAITAMLSLVPDGKKPLIHANLSVKPVYPLYYDYIAYGIYEVISDDSLAKDA